MKMCWIAAGLAGALVGPASAGKVLAVGGFDPFGSQSLYAIDSTTGAATLVGDTGVAQFTGLEWDARSRTLWGHTTDGSLYSINEFTGAANLIARVPTFIPEGGLAFDGSTLYGTDVGLIGSVDPATALFTPVAPTGVGLDFSAIAFDAAGMLVGVATSAAGDELYAIDQNAGGVTLIGSTGTATSGGVAGMDYDFDSGSLLFADGASLYTLDSATGAASLIGATGIDGISGLVVVPAPGAAATLVLAGFAAARRRRA
jgi:hypothetical protein